MICFGCPGICCVDQAGLELTDLPTCASASRELGLVACTTVLGPASELLIFEKVSLHGLMSPSSLPFPFDLLYTYKYI